MPAKSIKKYKLPRERGNPAMLPAQSKMCYDCGEVTGGRHEGAKYQVPRPSDYHYIDEEGTAYNEQEMKQMGVDANVSHGMCSTCRDRNVDEIRREQEYKQRIKGYRHEADERIYAALKTPGFWDEVRARDERLEREEAERYERQREWEYHQVEEAQAAQARQEADEIARQQRLAKDEEARKRAKEETGNTGANG